MKKLSFDTNAYKILYRRYKAYLVSLFVITMCVLIFFTVVRNQIQDQFLIQEEAAEAKKRISVLKTNLSLLSAINEKDQEANVLRVAKALPFQKDFAGVLNAIRVASSRAGVGISDYSFQVGDLAITQSTSPSLPSLTLTLTVQGDALGTQRFLQELSKTLPLSYVTSVELSGRSSTVLIGFFYKPLPSFKIDYTLPMRALSRNEMKLLDTLSGWEIPLGF